MQNRIQKALDGGRTIRLEEPCNCQPGRPMHNDGGNYHLVAEIKAGGTHGILVRYDDTCTLTPPEPFFKFDGGKTELADMVRKRIREGWSYSER